ncbi:MAG: tetratricopeptide repeat protein [Chlamydiota bacterium]
MKYHVRAAQLRAVLAALCAALLARAAAPAAPETPGADDRNAFRFAVLGDNQPHSAFALPNKVYEEILDRIEKLKPDFVVNVGDIINGSTNPRISRRQVVDFKESSKRLSMPYYVAFGNHDMAWNPKIIEEMVGPLYFSFNHKGAHFVLLNTDFTGQHLSIVGKQLEWLKEDLRRNAGAKPIFVFLHRPVFAVGSGPDSMKREEREKLHALFLAHGVSAVFSGHQHLYHVEEHDGIRYYITGGAGGPLLLTAQNAFYHFLLITVHDGKFDVGLNRMEEDRASHFMGLVEMDNPFFTQPLGCRSSSIVDKLEPCAPETPATTPAGELFARGFKLQKAGKMKLALWEYDAALAADPSLLAAVNNKAVILATGGMTRDAESLLAGLVGKREEPAEARFNLALLLAEAGSSPAALKLLREGLARRPESALLHIGTGLVFARAKDFDTAEKEFAAALSLRPEAPRLDIAELALVRGDFNRVISLCRGIMARQPGNRDALSLMGEAYAGEKKYREASVCYARLLEADPEDYATCIAAGNVYLQTGDNNAAIKAYTQALSARQDFIPALYNLSIAYLLEGKNNREPSQDLIYQRLSFDDPEKILDPLKTMISLGVRDELRAKALNNLATTLYLGGLADPIAIEQYLNQAIDAAGNLPQPRVNLGNIYWETDRIGLAGLSYIEALKREPACSAARYNLATLLVLEGKVDEGIDAYKELLARDPSYYRGWSSIAEVYMRRHMENPAETRFLSLALEAWRKSCRIKQEGNLACGMVEKIEREHPGVPNAEGAP